ncbi:hypothetical protein BGW80DRAFT_278445 [Lactifluus volemus]|nr:hypothetical protein BGW80DRAFT_278445 [Lactifluus volemus]
MQFNLLKARRGQPLRVVEKFILEFRIATRGDPAQHNTAKMGPIKASSTHFSCRSCKASALAPIPTTGFPYHPKFSLACLIWFSGARHCRALLINLGLDVTGMLLCEGNDVWSRSNNCSLCFTFHSVQTLSLLGCRIVKIGCNSMRSSFV